MISIALRIDCALDAVVSWFTAEGWSGFGVREDHTHEHWHFLVYATSKNVQAFRSHIKRKVPELIGNRCYSATEVEDLAKYERYCCKGTARGQLPSIAWRCHLEKYSAAHIQELHDAYWVENSSHVKKSKGSIIDFVVDEAKKDGITASNRRLLAKIMYTELVSRHRPLNLFAMKSSLNTVQAILCQDGKFQDNFLDSLENI